MEEFPPKPSIEVEPDPSYKLQKDLIFAAMCSWVICPHRDVLRLHSMMLVAVEAIREKEAQGRASLPNNKLLGDLFGRITPELWDFYNDLYYPIGGLKTLVKAASPKTFCKIIENRSADLPFFIGLMSILHFHADCLKGKRTYVQASLSKATPTTQAVYSTGSGSGWASDNIDDRWQRLKGTVALSYAASNTRVEEGRTLLDAMRVGKASYAQHGRYLGEWLGKSRYVAAHILAPMVKPDAARAAETYLPDIEARPFSARTFTSEDTGKIRSGFTAYNAR